MVLGLEIIAGIIKKLNPGLTFDKTLSLGYVFKIKTKTKVLVNIGYTYKNSRLEVLTLE